MSDPTDDYSPISSLIFDSKTTTRTDFQWRKVKPVERTKYENRERHCMRLRPPPLKEISTLTNWKVPNVPFDLFGRPKDVIHTDPRHLQTPFCEPPDPHKEKVQKSRPRLVITPAVSLDDIDEHRQLLVDDIYATSTHVAMQEMLDLADRSKLNLKSPLPIKPAAANPITLPPLPIPYVSPEWRMDSVSWDSRQLRSYSDKNRHFWLNTYRASK